MSLIFFASIPSLPTGGPLRVLAISGTLAMVTFAAVAWQRRRDSSALRQALVPLTLAVTTMLLRGHLPWLHTGLALTVAVAALYNAWCFTAMARWGSALGAAAWLVALACARRLFT